MKVVIAGGGMAGLAVAALLSRTGAHEVTVLERATGYGDAGYGIGLYPLGAATFNALGAMEELRARSMPIDRYVVHGPDGAVLQEVDLAELLARFGPMLGVTRTDLIDILASRVPHGVIRFGTTAVGVEADDDGVTVVAEDGSTYRGDVVVAADGMHSAIRRAAFGEVGLHDTGFHAWMWWAPDGSTPQGVAAEYWGPGAFVGLYPMPQGVNVAVGVPAEVSPDPAAGTDEIIAALRAVVEANAPGAASLPHLWDVRSGRPFLWPMQDVRAPAITALDDRVALVGDSGIGFLPTAGVGASNALRSAAALAYELSLADASSAQGAVARWAGRVQGLVEGNQKDSRHLAKVMMVRRKGSSAVINAVMKHMPVKAMTRSIIASMKAPF